VLPCAPPRARRSTFLRASRCAVARWQWQRCVLGLWCRPRRPCTPPRTHRSARQGSIRGSRVRADRPPHRYLRSSLVLVHSVQYGMAGSGNTGAESDTNNVGIEPVPRKLRAPRMSPCTPVIGCRAAASSLLKGSAKGPADLMYLIENRGYCIHRFAECEGDVGGSDLPNSRNQTARITVRGALRVPRQSLSFERPIVLRSSSTG